MTIIVHHLENSRSQRILWLLEELALPYEIKRYERHPKTQRAPDSLKAIHPLGKSPMIEDDGRMIIESGAIVEHICAHHGGDLYVPERGTDDYTRHLELIHFAEGSAMTPTLLNLYVGRLEEAGAPLMPRINEQLTSHFDFMENELSSSGHFIGDKLSAADFMLSFPAEVAIAQGRAKTHPKLAAFVKWLQARPAYQRGLEKGGEYSFVAG